MSRRSSLWRPVLITTLSCRLLISLRFLTICHSTFWLCSVCLRQSRILLRWIHDRSLHIDLIIIDFLKTIPLLFYDWIKLIKHLPIVQGSTIHVVIWVFATLWLMRFSSWTNSVISNYMWIFLIVGWWFIGFNGATFAFEYVVRMNDFVSLLGFRFLNFWQNGFRKTMSSRHFITLQKLFVEARFIVIEISGKVDNSSSHYDAVGWLAKPCICNRSGKLWHLLSC